MLSSFLARLATIRRAVLLLIPVALMLVSTFATAGVEAPGRLPADTPVVDANSVKMAPLPPGFDTVSGDWIHISYPPSLSHWVEPLMKEARDFKKELRVALGQPVLRDVRVRLATDPSQMATLAPVGAPYPNYAVGVAYSRIGLILLTWEGVHPNSTHDMREVLRHELAHVALHDALEGHHVPLWFNEGLAVTLSREHAFARTRALWVATVSGNLIPFGQLEHRFPNDVVGVPLAYAQSADVMRYLTRQQDAERFKLLVSKLRRGTSFDQALRNSFGMDTYNLEHAWVDDVEARYSFWPIVFSGTFIWSAAVVLVVVAWRKRRRRHRETLERWAREEALEDARAAQRLQKAFQLLPWVVARRAALPSSEPPSPRSRDSYVPKVEHEGDWHTLH